eukprot:112216-Rhodomonas_salina.5
MGFVEPMLDVVQVWHGLPGRRPCERLRVREIVGDVVTTRVLYQCGKLDGVQPNVPEVHVHFPAYALCEAVRGAVAHVASVAGRSCWRKHVLGGEADPCPTSLWNLHTLHVPRA